MPILNGKRTTIYISVKMYEWVKRERKRDKNFSLSAWVDDKLKTEAYETDPNLIKEEIERFEKRSKQTIEELKEKLNNAEERRKKAEERKKQITPERIIREYGK